VHLPLMIALVTDRLGRSHSTQVRKRCRGFRIDLWGHLACFQVMLRRYSEGIGHTIEERKHRDDVHRLGDLLLRPTSIAEFLHIVPCRTVSGVGYQLGIVHQSSLGRRKACFLELALEDRFDAVIIRSLNTQEVSVAVQSIRAAVQVGDVAGDHLLVAANQVAFGEVDGIGEVDDLAQEIGPRAEALNDSGHFGST